MSKYLVVEAEWLEEIIPFYADNCYCPDARDEAIANGDDICAGECLPCWKQYGNGKVRPLTAAEEKAGELHKAAFAYQKLAVCYRVGKRPTEKLFTELEKANKLLSTLAEQELEEQK